MKGLRNRLSRVDWTGWGTTLFAVAIAMGCWAVSYTTQAELAFRHGFQQWESWLWPGTADATALAIMFRLVTRQVRSGWPTIEAWVIFGIASAVMIVANVLSDLSDPLSAGMHAVVPIMAMLLWHVIVHGRPHRAMVESKRPPAAAPETRPVARARHVPPPVANTNGHAPVAVAQATGEACEICHQDPCSEPKKHQATLRKRKQRARMQEAVTA